jgi:hypothetical protein
MAKVLHELNCHPTLSLHLSLLRDLAHATTYSYNTSFLNYFAESSSRFLSIQPQDNALPFSALNQWRIQVFTIEKADVI